MTLELIEARPVTPASDLYSLGLVMAEMLSGRRVYTGSPIDICLKQVSPSPVPLPPEVLGTSLGPVIARAVEKRVEQRFASAAQMMAALGAAPAVPAARRTGKKLALYALAVVLALGLIGVLVVLGRG